MSNNKIAEELAKIFPGNWCYNDEEGLGEPGWYSYDANVEVREFKPEKWVAWLDHPVSFNGSTPAEALRKAVASDTMARGKPFESFSDSIFDNNSLVDLEDNPCQLAWKGLCSIFLTWAVYAMGQADVYCELGF